MDEKLRSDRNTVKPIHNDSSVTGSAAIVIGDKHFGTYGYHRELLLGIHD